MTPKDSKSLFQLNEDVQMLVYGSIYILFSVSIFPLFFVLIKAIYLKNRESSNFTYTLMNVINFIQFGQVVTHFTTGFALIFPVLHSKFNFFVNVMGSLFNGCWVGDFPVMVLLAVSRILIFTNLVELKNMPIVIKIWLFSMCSWTIFLIIYGAYTQYFVFVTPGWDYDYSLQSLPFFETQEIVISFTSLPLSYLAYTFMAYLIYKKKSIAGSGQSRKNETLILVQSTFVTVYLTILILIWHQAMFPFTNFIDMGNVKVQAVMNFSLILHCYVNPVLTLLCNTTIREECWKVLRKRAKPKKSISVSVATTRSKLSSNVLVAQSRIG